MIGLLDPATEIAIVIGLLTAGVLLAIGFAVSGMGSRRFTRRLRDVTGRNAQSARASGASRVPTRTLARRESATPGIDRVFLTGGSSFVPAVRAQFADRFGATKIETGDQLVSIAYGLSLIGREQDIARWAV